MSDPNPFIVLPAKSDSAVFCFCDHATNHIPPAFKGLGLSDADLQRHIAWDIGAETLTRMLCKDYGAAGLLAGFSRILIDPNRHTGSDTLIPEISDGTIIPGNQELNTAQRQDRIRQYYDPYHAELEHQINLSEARAHDPLIISIHSFTEKPSNGHTRDLDIGLLWKVDRNKAERVRTAIRAIHPYRIKLNEPYSAQKLNHSMDQHVIPRGLRHITFEIRQDLIDTQARAGKMAAHLSRALALFIKS